MPGSTTKRTVRIEPDIALVLKALRQSPERLDLAVRKQFREFSAEVREAAREAAARAHPVARVQRSRRTQKQHWRDLVNTIRSGSSSAGPTLSIGNDNVPWALGFEFGSFRFRQFPDWRGNDERAGYFFWPTVRARTGDIERRIAEALNEAMEDAFPE
jgi:hypothetical protein